LEPDFDAIEKMMRNLRLDDEENTEAGFEKGSVLEKD